MVMLCQGDFGMSTNASLSGWAFVCYEVFRKNTDDRLKPRVKRAGRFDRLKSSLNELNSIAARCNCCRELMRLRL